MGKLKSLERMGGGSCSHVETDAKVHKNVLLEEEIRYLLARLFDVAPDRLFTISTAPTLEQESGSNTSYTLAGMVYADMGHFSAHFMDASGRWWAYDGMVNSGQPSLNPITEDAQLTTLGDRVMHILLYRLNLSIPPL